MVGTYRQHLACVAAQLNGRQAPPLDEAIKSGSATGAGIAAELRGEQERQNQKPLSEGGRAGCKSPALASREGTGETFFLDILFHRMSEIGMLQQLTTDHCRHCASGC